MIPLPYLYKNYEATARKHYVSIQTGSRGKQYWTKTFLNVQIVKLFFFSEHMHTVLDGLHRQLLQTVNQVEC